MGPARVVFVARHGERIDHVNRDWKKSAPNPYDPFLTEKGLAQANALGKYLKSKGKLDHIFVSPFYRTVQTAHQVSLETGTSLKIEPGLGEYLNPEWFDYVPKVKSVQELSDEFKCIDTSYVGICPPSGLESRDEVVVRATCTAQWLATKYSGNILFVGHGMTCEFTARGLTGAGLRPYISYCSLQTCELEENSETTKYQIAGKQEVEIEFMSEDIRPLVYGDAGKVLLPG